MTDYPTTMLVSADELPDGWTGKNHACWTGVRYAKGEWYCFVDADVVSQPRLLEAAIEVASSEQIGLLSINPFQELVSASERCLLPGIFFAIASSMNFKNVNDPSRPEAVANGQFMLFRSDVYEAIGGHQAVRDEIMEDMAFAKIVKRSGNSLRWVFGEDLVKTRMYRTFSHIWEGFSKNLVDVMNIRSVSVSIYFCLKSLLLGWMPVILPIWTLPNLAQGEKDILSYWGCGLSLLGSVIMLMLSLSIIKALKIPLWHFLFFPLGLTMHAALIVNSMWSQKRGGRKWKDRVYLQN
jgi:chlorobactene glucosyltransferase